MLSFPALLALCLLAGAQGSPERLTPAQSTWLEDVSPILTKTEREVFLGLRSTAEREKFIRLFWRMRDLSPDTAENEFQKEYMERIRFADQTFGRESSKRGSQTDRGFYYLLLGPPLERSLYTTNSDIWPLELWFYRGEEEYGLPAYFYLIFYQPEGIGDYRLYSPGIEGPGKLVVPLQYGQAAGQRQAVQVIRKVNSELASAALSYLPGENALAGGGFSSDNIIASIKRLPEKKYSDAYARSYLTYKDYIETEYSDKFLSSAFLVRVLRTGGQSFLHWTIEPDKMNFASRGNAVYASYELVLRLEDGRGRPIFERTEEIPLRLSPEQYKAHESQRFAFQDLVPVIPGEYRALFLLKNKTAKDFSSFEVRVSVPEDARPRLSQVVLYHARDPVPDAQRANLKAFCFDGFQYLTGARNEFLPSETLGVFAQAWDFAGLKLDGPPSFSVEILSAETGAGLGTFPVSADVPPGPKGTLDLSAEVPLAGLAPGYYHVMVSALGPDGRQVLSEKDNFIVLARSAPAVPWVYGKLHGPFPGAEHLRNIGAQYFLAGRYGRAVDTLREALRLKDDPGARLLLAKSYFGLSRFKESLAEALPLFENAPDRDTAKVIALDYAGLKEWESALAYLEKLMAEATEVAVLNLAAECHLNLGRPERALPLLEKSLSLVPDQPAARSLEDKARKSLERR